MSTPEHGAEFAAAVRAVLADETHWVAWKKDLAPDPGGKMMTCVSFQRPPYKEPATLQKGRGKRPGGEPAAMRSCADVFKWLRSRPHVLPCIMRNPACGVQCVILSASHGRAALIPWLYGR